MKTLLTNAYTGLGQKFKAFKTNSITIRTKELLQRKINIKNIFHYFTKWHFERSINRMNGSFEMI